MLRKIGHILYQPYKWLLFFPLAFTLTVIFGIMAVVVSILVNQKTGSLIGGVLWARTIGLITPMFVNTLGKDNIDKNQSYIITPNHQSNYDIFALYGWLGIDIKWFMKKELKKIPGLGFGSQKVGHIFLDRSSKLAAAKSLEEAKEKLIGGTSVIIFPEGTRGNGTELLPFKRGAFKLAIELGLPILPISINGTKNIMPGKSKTNVLPGKTSIHIHKPIDIYGYSEANIKELMDKVKEIIESKLEM